MAKVTDSSVLVNNDTASTTLTFAPVSSLAGDLIVLVVGQANGLDATFSVPPGWSKNREDRNTDINCALYERLTTADNEALPSITSDRAQQWITAAFVYPGATGIGAVTIDQTSIASTLKQGPAIVATADESAILHVGLLERYQMTFKICASPNSRLLAQDITSTNGINQSDSALVVAEDFAPKAGDTIPGAVYVASSATSTAHLLYAIEILSDGTHTPVYFVGDHTEELSAYSVITNDEFRNAMVNSGVNIFTNTANVVATFNAATAVDTTLNRVTIPAHGFTHKSVVRLDAGGGTPPPPLVDGAYYYVNVIDVNTVAFRSAAAVTDNTLTTWYGGLVDLDLTAVGSGTMTLRECRIQTHSASVVTSTDTTTLAQPPNSNAASWVNWYGTTIKYTTPVDVSAAVSSYIVELVNITKACIVFVDAAGNWKKFKFSDSSIAKLTQRAFHIDPRNTTADASYGTLDTTQISMVFFGCLSNSVQSRGHYSFTNPLIKINPLRICGGDPATPISTADTYSALQGHYALTSDSPTGIMYAFAHDIIIGGGHSVADPNVHFRSEHKTIGFFDSYENGGRIWRRYSAPRVIIDVNAASSVDLTGCAFGATKITDVSVDVDRPSAATIVADGAKFVGAAVALRPYDSIANALFIACAQVTPNDATLVRPSFTNLAAPLVLSPSHNISYASFVTDTPTDNAIRITAAGTYPMRGWVFSGYSTVIDVTAATGTVVIPIAASDVVGDFTYQSAGAVVSIVPDVVNASGSVTGMIPGGRLFLFNMTTATEMVNAIQVGASYSISYPNGSGGYTAGDVVLMRWRKPGYDTVEATATATAGGWSFGLTPVVDPHTTLTTPANVTVDYVNQKIRATGARSSFTARELIDTIVAAEATVDGIRLPVFAAVSGLVELTPGVSTALTVELLNWQVSWAAGSVAQAFIGDGNVVGGVADDVVEDVVGGPQVTIMLAQSGTTLYVGGVAPSEAQIRAWVRAELATEMSRIDTLVSTAGLSGVVDKSTDGTTDLTMRDTMRVLLSALSGKLDIEDIGGGNLRFTFRNPADTKSRVVGVLRASDGDRTAITSIDPS